MSFLDKLRSVLNENPFYASFKINRTRPPGAVAEKDFVNLCIRCARCIAVCPYRSIQRAGASDGMQAGTPYIHAEDKGCYMCMLCAQVCPTGALDKTAVNPEDTRIGVAKINEQTCLNYIYARDEAAGKTDGMALYCNTCYNSCPLQAKAIFLKDLVIPIITDECTGCGICVERCPNEPRSVEIIPAGMADRANTGLYHLRKRATARDLSADPNVLQGEDLLKEKQKLGADGDFKFEYNFNTDNIVKEWE